jgi:hypothetical protein
MCQDVFAMNGFSLHLIGDLEGEQVPDLATFQTEVYSSRAASGEGLKLQVLHSEFDFDVDEVPESCSHCDHFELFLLVLIFFVSPGERDANLYCCAWSGSFPNTISLRG